MELSQQYGFLEEILLAPKRDSWMNELLSPNGWNNFDSSFDPSFSTTTSLVEPTFECPNFISTVDHHHNHHHHHQAFSFVDGFTSLQPENNDNYHHQQDYPSLVEDDNNNHHQHHEQQNQYQPHDHNHHHHQTSSTVEETKSTSTTCNVSEMDPTATMNDTVHHHQVFNMGLSDIKKTKSSKKLEGQPSKNLMAERRRRKRLNDRLSMLRSIVPKISKMDRTSILGDTIDYMKELLERINKLKEEEEEVEEETQVGIANHANLMPNFKELKPNEILVRNSPKFDVERRESNTRVDICCGAKPGLLLSTVSTIEALGLEIQQCVISCFNDFSLQASCSEVAEQRTLLSSEDIKQALFRNAGYGGRCL